MLVFPQTPAFHRCMFVYTDASKQWGGLVGSYHLPLWQHFFSRMHEFVVTNHTAPGQISAVLMQELNAIGAKWTNSTEAVPGLSSEATMSVATELLVKWKAAILQ